VVADRQRLAGRTEDHLLVGERARQAQGVDRDTGLDEPASPTLAGRFGATSWRERAQARSDLSGCRTRRARRRVELALVVALDDLDVREPRGRLPREALHQQDADREVRSEQDGDAALGSTLTESRGKLDRQPGRAADDVDL